MLCDYSLIFLRGGNEADQCNVYQCNVYDRETDNGDGEEEEEGVMKVVVDDSLQSHIFTVEVNSYRTILNIGSLRQDVGSKESNLQHSE
ncbi:MAG: hypothetical protein EZS28_011448 [Streblomastix strix]|uniref:Uncharacterized protein n=1 Tax=Streblomastix strix TaxID=222440 RepID=A0A5J4WF49_9EUKA|nr:MAG: hypothetical protein EZS28_011448 [Streblomastix strix]